MRPWWETNPERLEWELERLAELGMPAEVLTRDPDVGVDIATKVIDGDGWLPVTVRLPLHYPDRQPVVFGPPGYLPRHQLPQSHNFCLFEDPEGGDWWPAFSVADVLRMRLEPLLADSAVGPEAVQAGEADLPEPQTAFYAYDPNPVIVLPAEFWQSELDESSGPVTLVTPPSRKTIRIPVEADGLLERQSASTKMLQRAFAVGDADLRKGAAARWADCDGPPPTAPAQCSINNYLSPSEMTKLLGSRDTRRARATSGIVLLSFQEEGPTRGEFRRAWVGANVRLDKGEPLDAARVTGWMAVQALTEEARQARIPGLVALRGRRIAVIGAGSVGSPLVLELAKAGVGHVTVVDDDDYDVNNTVRHVLPVRMAGLPKVEAVASAASWLNPFIAVDAVYGKLGRGGESGRKAYSAVESADLVIDTSGAAEVGRLLHTIAGSAGVPVLIGGLSRGAHGGEILVAGPEPPCIYCFRLHQEDRVVPTPPEAPEGRPVTPIGCSHPAFSGAGFEATSLAAELARTAVRLFGDTDYPALDFNWWIRDFRSGGSQQGMEAPHADCPVHGGARE